VSEENPFRYGGLALDDAFMDRAAELRSLVADARNGQDVVLFAPRRYGKSSLVWRAAQILTRSKALVAQVDLMTAPTKERFAEKLAQAILEEVASPLYRAKERLRFFSNLRINPAVTVDPLSGDVSFSFEPGRAPADVDATIEHLLRLPSQIAAGRDRRVVLVLDEFQEVVDIDPGLPRLMRAVFQEQPEVAHIYLGSQRHMMERIFSDANEPFWRSAKHMELGLIDPRVFAPEIAKRFEATGRALREEASVAVFEITRGHPYATQELCYFLWQSLRKGASARREDVEHALEAVLQSEHAHFSRIWSSASSGQRVLLQALAREPGHPHATEYRRRHGLSSASSVQKALDALRRDELVAREEGITRLAEPFLAEWIARSR
jgi:hypothetical protein